MIDTIHGTCVVKNSQCAGLLLLRCYTRCPTAN
jgi:hypothetical protein